MFQSFGDRSRSEIDVRARHPIANHRERLAGVHVLQFDALRDQLVEPVHNVVARDDADFDLACEAQLFDDLGESGDAGLRIDAAGVGHDLDVVGQAFRQDAPDDVEEIARVTGVRVARPLLLHNGHRDLGQVIERQIIDRAALDQLNRGVEPISPETLSVFDSYCFHSYALSMFIPRGDVFRFFGSGNSSFSFFASLCSLYAFVVRPDSQFLTAFGFAIVHYDL